MGTAHWGTSHCREVPTFRERTVWHGAQTDKTYYDGSPLTWTGMVEGRTGGDGGKPIGSFWEGTLSYGDIESPARTFVNNSFVLGLSVFRSWHKFQGQRIWFCLCCLALCLTFASSAKERKNVCKILLRIWACFQSHASLAEMPLYFFFLSYTCVTAVEPMWPSFALALLLCSLCSHQPDLQSLLCL